jgi:hypothetical protein
MHDAAVFAAAQQRQRWQWSGLEHGGRHADERLEGVGVGIRRPRGEEAVDQQPAAQAAEPTPEPATRTTLRVRRMAA